MARDRANIRIDIWADQEWRELSSDAQLLYLLLLSHPTLSYAGVADWKPGRLAAMSAGKTREQIIESGSELREKFFIVIDEGSEEVLIRSFIKHDGLLKQPKLVVSMMNAYAAVASKTIREVIAFEVQKIRKLEPDLKVWEAKQAQTLLRAKATDIHKLTPNAGQGFTPAFTPNAGQAQGLPTSTTTTTATKEKILVIFNDQPFDDSDFKVFWAAYPRKVKKQNALKGYIKATKTATSQEIFEGLIRYQRVCGEDQRFISHADTWLNQARWTDLHPQYDPKVEVKGTHSQSSNQFGVSEATPVPPVFTIEDAPAKRPMPSNIRELALGGRSA